jgi:hypothetical protein
MRAQDVYSGEPPARPVVFPRHGFVLFFVVFIVAPISQFREVGFVLFGLLFYINDV